MNRRLKILCDYDGIIIASQKQVHRVGPGGFFRDHDDCPFEQSSRHGSDTPWCGVPWVLRDLKGKDHHGSGAIGSSVYFAIDGQSWLTIANMYQSGQCKVCPLVFFASDKKYGIDTRTPQWPEEVAEIIAEVT